MSLQQGYQAETLALEYLIKKKLQWLTSNYRCRFGEIDLIMKDHHTLVFIEVRARRSDEFGGALMSITHAKQQKIIKTAEHYLLINKLYDSCSTRFDVVSIQGKERRIDWIQNAFLSLGY